MKIAAAAYPIDWFESFADYQSKLRDWVARAEAELLIFPEYGAMELASLLRKNAKSLEQSISFLSELAPQIRESHQALAKEFNCTILGASLPLDIGAKHPVNRAYLYHPNGQIEHQDKQIMTRFEREIWQIGSGEGMQIFDIQGIKTGILICYDSEFPILGRKLVEMGAELILVPSCTDSIAGYNRVRIGAMARALEGQCVVVQSPTVGLAPWSEAVDENHGRAAFYAPPDLGFPETGVIAESALDAPDWLRADIDFAKVKNVRQNGAVFNYKHWGEQFGA